MPYSDLRKGRVSTTGRIYFVTTVVNNRLPIFESFQLARMLVQCMKETHNKYDFTFICWVIMPDHVHWLIQLKSSARLELIIKHLKANSAIRLNRFLNRSGSFWQENYYDHAVRREENVRKFARYVLANPIRAGLVTRIEQYSHWDAIFL